MLGGARVQDCAPHGHWGTTTMIGSVRLDGQSACMAVEGSMDRDVFRQYVRQVLVPTLREGDVVIWDNPATHDDATARQMIEAVSATIQPLPPYSPDMNPIAKNVEQDQRILACRQSAHASSSLRGHRPCAEKCHLAGRARRVSILRLCRSSKLNCSRGGGLAPWVTNGNP